jgi:hypothetical protein
VTFTFFDTPNTMIIGVERAGEPLCSMRVVNVEIVQVVPGEDG